jgi:hypothetical protein
MTARAIPALERILEEGGEPDDVLRSAVSSLAAVPSIDWVAIAFHEDGELVLGPEAGSPDESRRTRVPVVFQGSEVGELWIDGDVELAFVERVATLISAYVLIGWDTGGERWEP